MVNGAIKDQPSIEAAVRAGVRITLDRTDIFQRDVVRQRLRARR